MSRNSWLGFSWRSPARRRRSSIGQSTLGLESEAVAGVARFAVKHLSPPSTWNQLTASPDDGASHIALAAAQNGAIGCDRRGAPTRRWLDTHGAQTTAKVTTVLAPGGEACGSVDLTYESAGREVAVDGVSVLPDASRPGTALRLLYDPARPTHVRPVTMACGNSFAGTWLLLLGVSLAALVAALAGVVWIVRGPVASSTDKLRGSPNQR